MASSRKKKRGVGRVVLILILCLALIAVIAVTVGYSLVARRVKPCRPARHSPLITRRHPPPIPPPCTPSCKNRLHKGHSQRPVRAGRSAAEHHGPGRGHSRRPAHPRVRQRQRNVIRCGAAVQEHPLLHHRQLPAGKLSDAGLDPWQLCLAGPAGQPSGRWHRGHQPAGHD